MSENGFLLGLALLFVLAAFFIWRVDRETK